MRITTLLVVWSLPFLQVGEQAMASGRGYAAFVPHAGEHVAQATQHAVSPLDPGRGVFGASLEDEEESLEDGSSVDGLWLPESRHCFVRGELSPFAQASQDLRRIPSQPHPLRC